MRRTARNETFSSYLPACFAPPAMPKDALPLGREPEPGLRVNVGGTIMIITDVTDDEIVLDANHPLAGIPLHFSVRITDIADEAPEAQGGCGCGGTCSCN